MQSHVQKRPSVTAAVIFDLLDPVSFGFFVGALVFDAIYAKSAEVMWFKAAAWLIAIGLVVAIIPRLINLVRVWFPRVRPTAARHKIAFWLNLLGIVAAIVNAFVHSRDAYAVMPEGVWLSVLTVALLVAGHVVLTLQYLHSDIRSRA